MLPFLTHTRIFVPLTVLVTAAVPAAHAGWMGFRNDTRSTLVIQETLPSGAVGRAGKPQKIYTNETIRDTSASSGGHRSFTIVDSSNPMRVIYAGQFPCPAAHENVLFVLKFDRKGGLLVEAVRTPSGISKARKKN